MNSVDVGLREGIRVRERGREMAREKAIYKIERQFSESAAIKLHFAMTQRWRSAGWWKLLWHSRTLVISEMQNTENDRKNQNEMMSSLPLGVARRELSRLRYQKSA